MLLRIFLSLLIFSSSLFSCSLKDFDIEVISPSSGVSQTLWNKISRIIGKDLTGPMGTSEDQVFVDEIAKFQKLDKSLKSDHRIIWALRGGYGIDKIMCRVSSSDYSKTRKKIIIGYSDLTPLMLHLYQKYGWIAINAPMLRDFAFGDKSEKTYQTIVDLLKGKIKNLKFSDLKALNNKVRNVSGKIIGGNLNCIISTIGTPWQIETKGKIILIEDTQIAGYHLDRLLTHMKNAGLFDQAIAIVFGDFGKDVSKILRRFASKIEIPVFKSNSFGHEKANLPFVYGADSSITFSNNGAVLEMKPK